MSKGTDKPIDRRAFFVTAGKVIIPTLGLLGLSVTLGNKAQAAGCQSTCASNCTKNCVGSCTATCEGWNQGMVK